MEEQTK